MFKRLLSRGPKQEKDAVPAAAERSPVESRPASLDERELWDGFVVRCRTPREYLACVLDLEAVCSVHDAACYPCLVTGEPAAGVGERLFEARDYAPTPSLQTLPDGSLSDLVAHCADLARARSGHSRSCCLLLGDNAAAFLGAAFALHAGRNVLRVASSPAGWRLDGPPVGDCDSLMIVASAEYLAENAFDQVEARIRSVCPTAAGSLPAWAVLSAPNAQALSWLIARIKLRRQRPPARGRIVNFFNHRLARFHDPELEVCNGNDHPAGLLPEASAGASTYLAVSGHGHTFCLGRGYLCSGTRERDGARSCIPGYECIVDSSGETAPPSVEARNLRSGVVLLDSCFTANFLLGPVSGTNLVAHSLCSGAYAVIAPYRLNKCDVGTPYVVWKLLRQGMSVGQVAQTINECMADNAWLSPVIIPFADPDLRLFSGEDAEPLEELVPSRVDERTFELLIPPGTSALDLYCCKDPDLLAQSRESMLHGLFEASEARLLSTDFLHLRGEETMLLLVLWDGKRPSGSVKLRLTARPPCQRATFQMARQLLEHAIQQGLRHPASGAGRDDAEGGWEGQAEEYVDTQSRVAVLEQLLNEHEASVLDSFHRTFRNGAEYGALAAIESAILEASAAVGEEVATRLAADASESSLLVNLFLARRGIELVRHDLFPEPCASCGGPVMLKQYRVGAWPPEARNFYECGGCATFTDVPDRGTRLVLEGPSRIARSRSHDYILTGRNDEEVPIFVHAVLKVHKRDEVPGFFDVSPRSAGCLVDPGQDFRFEFSVEPMESLPKHWYQFAVYASLNGRLASTIRQVEVLD